MLGDPAKFERASEGLAISPVAFAPRRAGQPSGSASLVFLTLIGAGWATIAAVVWFTIG